MVLQNVEKRSNIRELVRTSVAFDPAIYDAILSGDECAAILKQKFISLKDSPFAQHIFPQEVLKPTQSSINNTADDVPLEPVSAKRLRLSLNKKTQSARTRESRNACQFEIHRYMSMTSKKPGVTF